MPRTAAAGGAGVSADDAQRADAFRRLADDQLEDSYRLANAILGSPTDARDAVHDAFISGWQRWSSLRDPDRYNPQDAWMRKLATVSEGSQTTLGAYHRPWQ